MAKYTCPSCGHRYNGKVCRNCLYENFSEEIPHGLHTHQGEPLVVDEPAPKPIRKKDPFACDKSTKKKHRFAPALIVLAVLFLFQPALALVFGIISNISEVVSPEPEPEIPALTIPLLESEQIQLLADLGDGTTCPQKFSVYLVNNSDDPVSVHAEDVVINGYVMEDAYLNCSAKRGRTAAGEFSVTTHSLEMAGIEQIQTLRMTLSAYNDDTYDAVLPDQGIELSFVDPASYHQPVSDGGQVLYEDETLRLVFQGYLPSSYSEDFSDGDLLFYLENMGNSAVSFSLESASLNGQEADLSFWCRLPAGTRAVDQIYLYPLEDLGITDGASIRSLTLNFQISDEDWQIEPVLTGPLELEALDG